MVRAHMAAAMAFEYASDTPHWMHWTKLAYQDGDGWAGVDLALYHYKRERLMQALQYAVSSAGRGEHNAAHLAGWMYEHGMGVAVDLLEAARWYGYAASLECWSIPVDMPMDELLQHESRWNDVDAIARFAKRVDLRDRTLLLDIVAHPERHRPPALEQSGDFPYDP